MIILELYVESLEYKLGEFGLHLSCFQQECLYPAVHSFHHHLQCIHLLQLAGLGGPKSIH